jgi:hypothetical protein
VYHLMRNLPVFGTLGVVALLVGPLARVPIDLGAWLLERFERWLRVRVNSSPWPRGRFIARGTELTCRAEGRRSR